MATAESAKKICVVCGKDVAGQPRVKDAAGRYLCAGECQQRAAAAAKAKQAAPPPATVKAAPPPAAAGGGSLMANLIEDSPMLKAAKCESCGSAMPGGSVICTRCGFNTQTGKALRTAVVTLPKEKTPSKTGKAAAAVGSTAVAAIVSPLVGGLLVFLALAGVGVAGAIVPEFLLASFVIMSISYLAAIIWALVDAAREQENTLAGFIAVHVVGMFAPYLPMGFIFGFIGLLLSIVGFFAAMWYAVFVTERGFLRALYLGTAAALIAWIVTVRMTDGAVFVKLASQLGLGGK
jgi:hypothetical protein